MKKQIFLVTITLISLTSFLNLAGQQVRHAKIAVIQASASPNQDPFMNEYDQSKVRPQMKAHFNRLLELFEKAGQLGADLVCGPEDMQHIGSYGLYLDTKDPETGKVLFSSLAVPVPGPLTDQVSSIAKKYRMYIIAPIYEADGGKVFNTAVIFDREGRIMGKHRKTLMPVLETWLVSNGDKYEVFQTDFAKVAVATCWEISYPEIASIYALEGADIIFNPTMASDNKPGKSLDTAPMFITRARDNSVYIAPVVLGTEGNGIIDFEGNVIAESLGKENTVIIADIDFSKERINNSKWWETINGTSNVKAMMLKSRRPDIFKLLSDPHPPVLDDYKNIHLTTGDLKRQIEAVHEVDYGPKAAITQQDLNLVPFPRKIKMGGEDLVIGARLTIVLDKNASAADKFAAEELIRDLKSGFNISAVTGKQANTQSIVLTHNGVTGMDSDQGYQLTTGNKEIVIRAGSEAGLFYGTQTLLQLIRPAQTGNTVPAVTISDWPDIAVRAIHYDTKHHQDKASYVKAFIKDLSHFKINMLVWEWEDKFAYPSHPELGAPGAFTADEMKEFTRYARQYHIQIVPLVQGLGHVSFILKWPQYKNLREIESSNWEFCPLKDGSYNLLNDIWKDAVNATPGSDYIHIGSDETYELASCDKCRAKAEEIGKSGLYQLFINRAADYLTPMGRKVMAWETPMGWEKSESPAKGIKPAQGLVFTESYDYETPGLTYAKEAKSLGFEVFAYDPNPGVVPMMVPYYFELGESHEMRPGSLEKSYRFLSGACSSGAFRGMICTSWDDDDLHNQMWMMHFANAASISWNSKGPSPDEFRKSFFSDYYSPDAKNLDELFRLLNEGAYYFAWTMERNVWHYGEIGKTHLPDLPRGDALEYDPFWNTQYKDKVMQSEEMLKKMDRALAIIAENRKSSLKHGYDLEICRTTAEMVKHTCMTYLDLSELENTIRNAHVNRFVDYKVSLDYLMKAQKLLENLLMRRDSIFRDLVAVYEQTRLPKGFSTKDKQYFWQQDRARHFAFRRPDMTFLIYNEQLLDIEGYLDKLKNYTEYFRVAASN